MDMDKDYYKIMGVSEDASEKDIKMAYRKLARKYHPDISKEPDAEARFKEMGEAYETLKDPAKKAEYDSFRKHKNVNQKGHYRQWRPEETEPFSSAHLNEDLFETLFGHSRYRQQPMPGQNYHGTLNISLEEALTGTEKNIQVPVEKDAQSTMQTIKVKVPAGVKAGQKIRLTGQGAAGIHGGPRGDIYLTIAFEKHSLFDVLEGDIYLTLPITPWEAALGATVVVPTLAGKIDLKIPPGSQGGQKLRLKNRGLPGTTPGHQYVLLKIITPPPTTEAATELYKKMAKEMPFNPRTNMGA